MPKYLNLQSWFNIIIIIYLNFKKLFYKLYDIMI